MKLRPYQEESKEAVFREWRTGKKNTLLVLPTGTGKTIVFAKIAEEAVRQGGRGLILAHRGELLDQAQDKIEKATGLSTAREQGEHTSIGDWSRIVVGSVQSMVQPKRLQRMPSDYFDFIIIDEAHHVLSNTYLQVIEHFDQAKLLGVTATPDRGDMRNIGTVFESLAYEYSLPEAIKDGYLSPIKAMTIPLEIDITSVGQQSGDFSTKDLGTALDPYLEQIADEMERVASDRKTVVFLPLVKTSQKFRDILNKKGFRAAEVNGSSKDRKEILEDFEAGKYNVLCNSMLLTEGWDCPSVDCVIVLRPTRVRSLYSQMVGRGTRLHPGKDHLLLLDFLWHTDRHELVHPAHLIAEDEDVAKKMTEKIEDSEEAIDIGDIIEEAREDVTEEREERLAEHLAANRKKKAKLVDPISFAMSIDAKDWVDYEPVFGQEVEPPTQEQIRLIEKEGVATTGITTKGKADEMIKRLKERNQKGLTTAKQIRQLQNRGYVNVDKWTFEQARNLITQTKANHWRTVHRNPSEYVPS